MIVQCLVWLCIIILPAFTKNSLDDNPKSSFKIINDSLKGSFPYLFVYFVNYLLFVPKFLFVKGRRIWFYLINILLNFGIIGFCIVSILYSSDFQQFEEIIKALPFEEGEKLKGFAFFLSAGFTLVNLILIVIAVGVRYIARWNEQQITIKEEEKQKTQAELTWLRYQLNPHFLFNAMNNISSLTQIDPCRAQEEIARLSDVLRYTLYDAEKPEVTISSEIEFMEQYVGLMKMRCNELSTVNMEFNVPNGDIMIAPLLFISLIENAFKHGINSRKESFVNMDMHLEGRNLVFRCTNSIFEKIGEDRVGSGIGLENVRQRLSLLYPGKHSFNCGISGGEYVAEIIIKDLIINE